MQCDIRTGLPLGTDRIDCIARIHVLQVHASPPALTGGVDAGGQNIYVAHIARHLAALGYEVDVFARRDDDRAPEVLKWSYGVRVIHAPAGPAAFVRKENLLLCPRPFCYPFSDRSHRGECKTCPHSSLFSLL